MKNLFLVSFLFLSTVLFGQRKIEKNKGYRVDKNLALSLFKTINEYRKKEGIAPYIWSEDWYNSSLQTSEYLATNSLWGHYGDGYPENMKTEMIVGMNLLPENDLLHTQKFISDSCLNQFLNSPYHSFHITMNLYSEKSKTQNVLFGKSYFDLPCSKYLGISCVVLDYGHYKQVQFMYRASSDNFCIGFRKHN